MQVYYIWTVLLRSALLPHSFSYIYVFFPAETEHSSFSVNFRLKIFLYSSKLRMYTFNNYDMYRLQNCHKHWTFGWGFHRAVNITRVRSDLSEKNPILVWETLKDSYNSNISPMGFHLMVNETPLNKTKRTSDVWPSEATIVLRLLT